MKIVKRVDEDGRRKILALTAKGVRQRLNIILLANADRAFKALFAEIECDLDAATARAKEALARRPILDRVRALKMRVFVRKDL